MTKSIALSFGFAAVALCLFDTPAADAQVVTIVETTTPERRIPPPPEVRGKEHLARNNPYFGLRSSFPSIRQYYSNPVKTIPGQTRRTVILNYGYGVPYYGGFRGNPFQFSQRYRYGYGYPYGNVRRW
ncbi:MAG: hypothetical protein AAGG48_11415 [Planctomycetota bacterium]